MTVRINEASYLRFTELLDIDGLLYFDLPSFPAIEPQDNDIIHEVKDTEVTRLDLIANQYYGDSDLWWVIMLANDKLSPNEFIAGERIRVPAASYVMSNILSKGKV